MVVEPAQTGERPGHDHLRSAELRGVEGRENRPNVPGGQRRCLCHGMGRYAWDRRLLQEHRCRGANCTRAIGLDPLVPNWGGTIVGLRRPVLVALAAAAVLTSTALAPIARAALGPSEGLV